MQVLPPARPPTLTRNTQRMLFVALSIFCVDGPPLPGKSTFLALRHLGFAPARILDVGANAGHWTRGILRVFPSASVVMVEANEARRQDWRGLPASVRGLISVLSDKEGEVPWFTTPGAATGDSMFQERTSWVATSNMTRHALTLDGLLAREGLADGPFGLIKLDVQGAELTVLRGAARALSQAEVLFMELPLVSARKRPRAWHSTYVHVLHGHAHAHLGSSTRARGIGCAHSQAFGPSRGVRVATRAPSFGPFTTPPQPAIHRPARTIAEPPPSRRALRRCPRSAGFLSTYLSSIASSTRGRAPHSRYRSISSSSAGARASGSARSVPSASSALEGWNP